MSKKLQGGGANRVSVSDARVLFDGLLEKFHESTSYLGILEATSSIVHSPDFDNAVVKLKSGLEFELTERERQSVEMFLRADAEPLPDSVVSKTNFADDLLNKRRRLESSRSRYRSTMHVSATSNVCERLFSNARIIMTHLRSSMDPRTCEMLLFLKYNWSIWSNPRIIDEICNQCDADLEENDGNQLSNSESDEEA